MLKSLRKPKKKRALRIFFATDVHGSDVCFRKFLAAAKVYEADVLLLGGDFAGKGLVPVLRDGDELRTEIDGKEVSVPADGWDQLTADINRRGFYAAQMERRRTRRTAPGRGRARPQVPQRDRGPGGAVVPACRRTARSRRALHHHTGQRRPGGRRPGVRRGRAGRVPVGHGVRPRAGRHGQPGRGAVHAVEHRAGMLGGGPRQADLRAGGVGTRGQAGAS